MSATPAAQETREATDDPDQETADQQAVLENRYPVNQPREFEPVDAADQTASMPSHLIEIENPNQDAVCECCGNWVVIGPDETEYGHREDCDHRPGCVETFNPRITGGGR